MPSKKRKDGTYRDVAHPLNQETRTEMEEKILKMYLAEIKGERSTSDTGDSAQSGEAAGAWGGLAWTPRIRVITSHKLDSFGPSTSGKSQDFDSCIPRFES